MRLFHVVSIANNVQYNKVSYDNVTIDWFVVDRKKPPVPYENSIFNYHNLPQKQRENPEAFINELFTEDEALQIKEYLEKRNNVVKIDPAELPIADIKKGHKSFEVAEGTGFYVLHRKENYPFSFKVEGFFNVNLADESLKADDRVTVISKINPVQEEQTHKTLGDEDDEDIKTQLFVKSFDPNID